MPGVGLEYWQLFSDVNIHAFAVSLSAMSHPAPAVYRRLLSAFGPQHWWPGDSPFEIMVGAILVQNTSWKNVERGIENLREAGVLEPRDLYELPVEELEELLRPVGYYRIKARRLRNLLRLLVEEFGGDVSHMLSTPMGPLRELLLGVHGIGPETADSIVLYAAEQPSFVVDTYTHRVLARHGWIGYDVDYHQLQSYFHDVLPHEVELFNEFHALLVRVGHLYCRKQPKCEECPLREMLPEGGPIAE